LWTNVWNGENRRITIESRSTLPAGGKMKEVWTHLADGRWIERVLSTNNGTSYFPSLTNRYVWDGQILLAVLDHTNGVVVSFVRGLDLSGSIQGAGGVGGVLAVRAGTSAQCGAMANTTHFTCYDGNGNVTALVKADSGELTARYEYGAFAERLRETGPMAKLNPIRFSTQYTDDVIGDVKYLHRDYDSDGGRWLSRDPINEVGLKLLTRSRTAFNMVEEKNLYGFVRNNPVSIVDPFGLWDWPWSKNKKCCKEDDEGTKAVKELVDHATTGLVDKLTEFAEAGDEIAAKHLKDLKGGLFIISSVKSICDARNPDGCDQFVKSGEIADCMLCCTSIHSLFSNELGGVGFLISCRYACRNAD